MSNLIVNGDFSLGLVGWTTSNVTTTDDPVHSPPMAAELLGLVY